MDLKIYKHGNSVTMLPLVLCFIFLFSKGLAEDTVAEDIGPHQLERLVGLLTARECEELISVLSHVEENVFQRLDRLSPERNQLQLETRRRRNTNQEPCRSALKDWLQTHGRQIYYDRLSRALQQIGRTDIAIEVGKNINQDKILAMQRYVDGYHDLVNKMAAQQETHQSDLEDNDDHEEELPYSPKQARGFTWEDVDLVVKRQPVPPSQRRLFDIVWPLLYGLVLGFAGALLVSVSILLITIYVSHGNTTNYKTAHHHPLLGVVTSSGRAPSKTVP
nr:transmembrane and death domain protein 1-like isoform X1 [Misgurnus anguillicaudatus]